MSALFHPYLCGRIAAEWLINMKIQEYIKQQLETDQITDQMSLKKFIDPFTGSKH